MKTQKKKNKTKLPGCLGCEWGPQKDQCFVLPEPGIGYTSKLIVLLDSPMLTHEAPFLYQLFEKHNIAPVVLSAVQCSHDEAPSTKVITSCREAYTAALLAGYPLTPVLAMGAKARHSIMHGKGKEEDLLGSARIVDGREVYFTYSPSDYLADKKRWDILDHIQIMLGSAIASTENRLTVEWTESNPPDSFWDCQYLYLDDEAFVDKGTMHPAYGSRLRMIGVANETSDIVYTFSPGRFPLLFDRLRSFRGTLVGHNLNSDGSHLLHCGVRPLPKLNCTLIRLKVKSDARFGGNDLKWLLKKKFGLWGYEAVVHTKWDNEEDPTWYELAPYNAIDVIGTKSEHEDQLQDDDNRPIYDLAMEYLPHIIQMEANGFKCDVERLSQIEAEVGVKLLEVKRKIEEIVGKKIVTADEQKQLANKEDGFNPNSHPQLLAVFRSFGLNLESTKEDVLEEYADEYPLVGLILELRGLEKIDGTYCKGYKEWLAPGNLIHSTYGVEHTKTGRCNSKDPNLQNTPRIVRPAMISRYPNGRLVSPDLSALEYRLIGEASRCPVLVKIFDDGKDIHRMAASMVLQKPESEIDSKTRKDFGKVFNFAGVYGAGDAKLAAVIGRNDPALFARVRNMYPGVNTWKDSVLERLHHVGTVENIFGRKRKFYKLDSADEREAINWIIQSSGHTLLKLLIIEILRRFEDQGFVRCLLAQEGHDSGVFDCPDEEHEMAAEIIKSINLNELILSRTGKKFRVPMLLDSKTSERWE